MEGKRGGTFEDTHWRRRKGDLGEVRQDLLLGDEDLVWIGLQDRNRPSLPPLPLISDDDMPTFSEG